MDAKKEEVMDKWEIERGREMDGWIEGKMNESTNEWMQWAGQMND